MHPLHFWLPVLRDVGRAVHSKCRGAIKPEQWVEVIARWANFCKPHVAYSDPTSKNLEKFVRLLVPLSRAAVEHKKYLARLDAAEAKKYKWAEIENDPFFRDLIDNSQKPSDPFI